MNNLDRIQKEANKIFTNFSKSISSISINRDFECVIHSLLALKNSDNKVITTGMGKAGIAMRKFSSTLCSLGFPSAYLHPGEASHGDLGLLRPKDILFVASTSGKTREIMEIMELARKVNVQKIIGITSHPDSPVRKKCDLVIDMGDIKEAGHLGLAPTTSILKMIALTDSIALIAAKESNFTKEDYALRHHSGYLGQAAKGDKK